MPHINKEMMMYGGHGHKRGRTTHTRHPWWWYRHLWVKWTQRGAKKYSFDATGQGTSSRPPYCSIHFKKCSTNLVHMAFHSLYGCCRNGTPKEKNCIQMILWSKRIFLCNDHQSRNHLLKFFGNKYLHHTT